MNTIPQDLARLLMNLGYAGVELAPHAIDAARLLFKPGVLPPDLLERLRTHKTAVLGLLVNGYKPTEEDAGYLLVERLGMADDLKLSTHPGSAAWLVAVGESLSQCCHRATTGVQCRHGTTDKGNSGGDNRERPNPLCDRQRRGSGP